ncbi:MAG: hypothetical protein PHC88_16185, partial [Terrimicrobiaceae bacterium]|nr:hypothetical protein [Terrimicrobiaceae bacterium]
ALLFPQVRRDLKSRPETRWLLLWALGGLLLMTFIPAKRVDRIYPVVPPLCLLAAEWCAALWTDRRVRIATGAATLAALLFAGGYFIGLVPLSIKEGASALVEFSARARATAASHGVAEITLPRARDDGLLLYFDRVRYDSKSDALARWKAGLPIALVLSDRSVKQFFDGMVPPKPAMVSDELRRKNERRYYLFLNH